MEFSKKELRDNRNPLLQRITRQVTVSNERQDIEYAKLLSAPNAKQMNQTKSFGMLKLDGYSEPEPEEVLFAPMRKQTRLGLLKQRGGR